MLTARLRRDAKGFLGYGGTSAIWSTFFFVALVQAGVRGEPDWFFWVLLLITGILPACWIGGRTVITEGFLVSGVRWSPQRVDLASLASIEVGRVPWSRGLADGLVLVMVDESKQPLRLSATLGRNRRDEWLSKIAAAVESNAEHVAK